MSPLRLVVGGLVVDDLEHPTRVLAGRRTKPAELAGRWEFPGGKVEPGETRRQALRRELHEELGIEVRVGDELTRDGSAWPISPTWELRLFYAVIESGTPQPGDSHDEVRWLESADLPGLDWLDSDLEAVSLVVDRFPAKSRQQDRT